MSIPASDEQTASHLFWITEGGRKVLALVDMSEGVGDHIWTDSVVLEDCCLILTGSSMRILSEIFPLKYSCP